jgi:hypothetical protein
VSASLSPTADRLAAENTRRTKERARDIWATAVAHWQRQVDDRRLIHDETAAAVAQAFAAMQTDNARFDRPVFVNTSDPSSVSGPQRTWLNSSEQLRLVLVDMNRAEALLGYSRQQLSQAEAELEAIATA